LLLLAASLGFRDQEVGESFEVDLALLGRRLPWISNDAVLSERGHPFLQNDQDFLLPHRPEIPGG
jgi:hypothetical protein